MDAGRHFIIGTAGHIDHGKTALVKALTGIDADRLKEEQERGMTIDLGYAFLDVAGQRVGIVDVPGHEKFVKNMLAGATGIDMALFLVAADDGVMPQTVEHLEILDLLGIRRGIVVITKIDLVEDDLRAIVREEVGNLLHGTALEGTDIAEVSSITGAGIEDLKRKIGAMVSKGESDRALSLPFRLPVDRVFTQQGFGCVVTGSVMTGTAANGATLEIAPGGFEVRVRAAQVHGAEVDRAVAGQRTALNLSGVKAEQIARGCVLSEPRHLAPSDLIDAHLRFLKTAKHPLKHNARVRFHAGTTEVMARVSLLQGNQMKPGGTGFVQFKLEQPAAVQRGDRYVIRSYSPTRTIGGGQILRRKARRLKRNREEVLAPLCRLISGDPAEIVEQTILDSPPFTLAPEDVCHAAELSREQVDEALRSLSQNEKIIVENRTFAHNAQLAEAGERIVAALKQFHAANRLAVGMVPAQLMSHARIHMPREGFAQVLGRLKNGGAIKEIEGLIALADAGPKLSAEERLAVQNLEAIFVSGGYSPPSVPEAIAKAGSPVAKSDQLLEMLMRSGKIVRLTDDLCLHASAMEEIKKKIVEFLREKGRITVVELKDLLGVSRKFAIPIAEYLDKIGITQRVGNERRLKQ